MAVATTFRLASSFRAATHVGKYSFSPNVTYNQTSYPLKDKDIANAFAKGILVFADATSLSEVQTNPVVAQLSADSNRAGGVTGGATATTPRLRLASTVRSPMSFGPYTLQPNTTYQDSELKITDPNILVAIARGFIVFADSTNILTFLADPIVSAKIGEAEDLLGYFGPANVYGV